jgi:hypothetical protein
MISINKNRQGDWFLHSLLRKSTNLTSATFSEILDLLKSFSKANINTPNTYGTIICHSAKNVGNTPLHIAAVNAKLFVVQALLQYPGKIKIV